MEILLVKLWLSLIDRLNLVKEPFLFGNNYDACDNLINSQQVLLKCISVILSFGLPFFEFVLICTAKACRLVTSCFNKGKHTEETLN